MIVLDASAAVDLLLRRGAVDEIAALVRDHDVATTELLCTEVLQVLRRYLGRGQLGEDRAKQAVADLQSLPIEPYPLFPMTEQIWALRGAITAYDAAYVALSETLEATLVTTDHRLARAAATRCAVADLSPRRR